MAKKTPAPSRFSHVRVKLVGKDGNAYAIIGEVVTMLRRNGATKAEVDAYQQEATSGDYDHLLQVTMRWVDVC